MGYWGENPFGVVDRILAILNRKIEKDEKTQEYNFSRNINSQQEYKFLTKAGIYIPGPGINRNLHS